jgi:hypothetical protein
VCVGVNICMNDGALRAVKKLYIRLCAARDSSPQTPLDYVMGTSLELVLKVVLHCTSA